MKRLLFIVNVDWFFLSHRLPIALEAIRQGYEVHLATVITGRLDELNAHGLIVHPLSIARSSTGLWGELRSFFQICLVLRAVKPSIAHLVTIKPVIFGGIAARVTGVPGVLAAISGLGFVFGAKGYKASFMRVLVGMLYRMALGKRNLKVVFQNPDDRDRLTNVTGLQNNKCVMIKGSGVDLDAWVARPFPDGVPLVVMAARLLVDKGVREFVQAAYQLRQRGVAARFCLVGSPDPGNPASITEHELKDWRDGQCVELLRHREDIADVFAQAHVVVLPSYYGEGLPKVLIEAAACGRAVVTTDMPGCRDAIEPNVTGLLVPARDVDALAEGMRRLIEDKALRESMGQAGRRLAEREFSIKKVVDEHLSIYKQLIDNAA